MNSINLFSIDLDGLEKIANVLMQHKNAKEVIYLSGSLGAGKTTFTRNYMQCLGYKKRVKSPTYSIIETYEFNNISLAHLDLYRMSSHDELHFLAIDDILAENDIILIEWPDNFIDALPKATLKISIDIQPDSRDISIYSNETVVISAIESLRL